MPLLLDLLRHGQALPADNRGDAARRLSDAGRDSIVRLAERFAREGWQPGAVFCSPLTRAQETAAILLARANPGLEPTVLAQLIPDADPEAVTRALAERALPGHVVLVGHQPLMGRLAAHLAGGPEPGFATGALVRLGIDGALRPGGGLVQLEIQPERGY